MNIKLALIASVFCLTTSPAMADEQTLSKIIQTVFSSIDLNGNDRVSLREVEHFHGSVMLSMDYDDNGKINQEEFLTWDLGWMHLAAERDLSDEYRAARIQLFNTWDENRDGTLSEKEQEVDQAKRIFRIEDTDFKEMSFEDFINKMPLVSTLNQVFDSQ